MLRKGPDEGNCSPTGPSAEARNRDLSGLELDLTAYEGSCSPILSQFRSTTRLYHLS
jgi:hypothetical protein